MRAFPIFTAKFLTTPQTNNCNMLQIKWESMGSAHLLGVIGHRSTFNNDAKMHHIHDTTMLMHFAAHDDDADMAQQLIERGYDVDAKTDAGITPLSHATLMKSSSVIKVLLAANADIFSKGLRQRHSPVQRVLGSDSRHNADTISAFLERIRKDASGDSVAMAKVLLDADCPLPWAIFLRDVNATRYMLEHGRSANDVDRDGNTALHFAVKAPDWEQVELLIERGADVRAVNNDKRTPLHLYRVGNDPGHRILRALLNNNAPLYDVDISGYMAVTRIFDQGDSETVRAILQYDIDLDATRRWGTTLLHYVASNKNPGVIQQLRGRKFNANAIGYLGLTPLCWTLCDPLPESLKFLLENGADLNIRKGDGETAFFDAISRFVNMQNKARDCLKCIELFLQYGAADDPAIYWKTIFDKILIFKSFVLTRPILEYVAMRAAIGKPVATNEVFLSQINSHEKFRGHLEFCKRRIEKMKRVVIFEKVTLFNFLTDNDEKLEKYARNAELVEKLKRVIYSLRRSKLYFVKFLRKRVEKAIKAVELREQAAVVLSKVECLGANFHVVEKILSFVDGEDLRNLCLI